MAINKNVKIIAIGIVIGLLISSAYIIYMSIFSKRQLFHDTLLAENVLITSEWQEIDVKGSVKIERDRHFIALVLEPPFETPYGTPGIKIPGGRIVNPEIVLVDKDGNEYLFSRSGAGGTDTSRYEHNGVLPVNKSYEKVLLRSESPIRVRKLLWSGYYFRDLK